MSTGEDFSRYLSRWLGRVDQLAPTFRPGGLGFALAIIRKACELGPDRIDDRLSEAGRLPLIGRPEKRIH